MKKNLLALAMLLVTTGAMADELKVANVVLPQNATAEIQFELENPNVVVDAFSFSVNLPDGVVPVMTNGGPSFIAGNRFVSVSGINSNLLDGNILRFARQTDGNVIQGTSGVLFSAVVKVDGELAVGTELTATVSDILVTTPNLTKENLDPVTFTITIGEPVDPRTILDETSTSVPAAATGVDVRVKRTIKANEWSTICLPFAMSETQMKAAFGSDVELADFTGYDTTMEGNEVVGITVNFNAVTAIEANHPYIIKVSDKVTEFTVDGVTIEPVGNPSVSFGTTTGKGKNTVYHPMDFNGTYVADYDFYNAATSYPLFLNGNKFYYATPNTMHMKAFRAYFDFDDYLPEANEAAAKVRYTINGAPTAIEGIAAGEYAQDGAVYDLSGRRLSVSSASSVHSVLPKGMYIVNGKKVIVK